MKEILLQKYNLRSHENIHICRPLSAPSVPSDRIYEKQKMTILQVYKKNLLIYPTV